MAPTFREISSQCLAKIIIENALSFGWQTIFVSDKHTSTLTYFTGSSLMHQQWTNFS
jgi:hypothetical protein